MIFRWLGIVLVGFACVTPLAAETPKSVGTIPLVFEPNLGQTNGDVRFLSRGSGFGFFLTEKEAVIAFAQPAAVPLRMKPGGATTRPEIEAIDLQQGTSQYFRGRNANKWQSGVPHYSKVRYRHVYPGIDLTYYGSERQIEYDFAVAPHANPAIIRMDFSGASRISIDEAGDLILHTASGDIRHRRPTAYQQRDGRLEPVAADFELRGKQQVGFSVGDYDRNFPLIIDPVILYSTYFGGTTTGTTGDQGNDIAIDSAGNMYVTGQTTSTDFPAASAVMPTPLGLADAFVLKLSPAGAVLASTYFGGTKNDEGHAIGLDGAGNVYVTGTTSSSDLPIVGGFQTARAGLQDAYLLKLNNAANAIVYSTYLGGNDNDQAFGLAVDAGGNAYIAGTTSSRNFPLVNVSQTSFGGGLGDSFVTKISSGGGIAYSTYWGGIGNDQAYDIAIDADGNAYFVGFTTSLNFPSTTISNSYAGGSDDLFMAKIGPAGNQILFSTMYGGAGSEEAVGVALDADRNVYVTGYTTSPNFPIKADALQTTPPLSSDLEAFLLKLPTDGSTILVSTFLGGTGGSESGSKVALDAAGNIYIAGFTTSLDFIVVNTVQNFLNGLRDGFLLKLSPDASEVIYSTFVGGSGIDAIVGLAVDPAGNAYVTGFTSSVDYPVTDLAAQLTNAGGNDIFITKINADDIQSDVAYTVPNGGGMIIQTQGGTAAQRFGYGRIDVSGNQTPPTGLALIDYRSAGIEITNGAFLAGPFLTDARFLVEYTGLVVTGVSIVNPWPDPITVEYIFTDLNSVTAKSGTFVVDPGVSMSGTIVSEPFGLDPTTGFSGTLNLSSDSPMAIVGIRQESTIGNRVLLSSDPVFNPYVFESGTLVLPRFADGVGWTTEVNLINPGEDELTGEVRFFGVGDDPTGPAVPIDVTINGTTGSVFPYDITGRTVQRFTTQGLLDPIAAGFVEIVPTDGPRTPSAFLNVNFSQNGSPVMVAPVEAQSPASTFRLYVESEGDWDAQSPLSSRTAISLTNNSSSPVDVNLELFRLDGTPTGLSRHMTIVGRGHIGMFLSEMPEFAGIPDPFQGVLRVSASAPVVTGVSFRGHLNDVQEFLATTTGPLKENVGFGPTVVFPHLLEGAGYATKFILISGANEQGSSGVLQLRDDSGKPLNTAVRVTH